MSEQLFDIDELSECLEQFKQQVSDPKILVAGDDRAKWGTTVKVLDTIRKEDFEKVSMEAQTRQTDQ